jgi:excisionase family DNA binding protein
MVHNHPSTVPAPTPLLLTKREAARELRISERSVHTLIAQGRLPAVRVGTSVRVDRRDLFTFIDNQKQATTRAVPPSGLGCPTDSGDPDVQQAVKSGQS